MLGKILVFLALSCSAITFGQLEHFTVNNGLPSDRVYDVAVDNKGFLWVATDKGIANYNGNKFTIYNTGNGLPVNDIFSIVPTGDGKLWYFGKSDRLGYIQNGQVHIFQSWDNSIMNPVKFVIYGNQVGFFFGKESYYLKNGYWRKFVLFLHDHELNYTQYFINPLFDLHIGISSGYFTHFNNKRELLKRITINEPGWNRKSWSEPFYLNNNFYLMTSNNLYHYDFLTYTLTVLPWKDNFEFRDYQKIHFFYDNNQFGVTDSRLRYIITGNKVSLQCKLNYDLPDSSAVGLYPDLYGNVWLNTQQDGIYRYPYYMKTQVLFKNRRIQKLEIIGDVIYAGIEDDGLYQVNLTNNQYKPIFSESKYFYRLEKDQSGKLKVLTNYDHFYYSNNKIEHLTFTELNGWPSSGGKDSYISNDSLIILYPYTIHTADLNTKKEKSIIWFIGAYDIEKFHSSYLLATSGGLKLLYNSRIFDADVIPRYPLKCLVVWKNKLIAGTEGYGIYYGDKNDVKRPEFLNSESINNLYVDSLDNLWICTNNGVHEVTFNEKNELQIFSILKSNGLSSNIVNDVRISNDHIYAATDKGLCKLNRDSIPRHFDLGIIVPTIELNDSSYKLTEKDLKVEGQSTNSISVVYDIGFLGEHSQIKTYYKLEPLQTDWTETSSREIDFAGLPSGKYILNIKAEAYNNTRAVYILPVEFQPRWYEYRMVRFMIIISGVLVFISIVILIAYYIIRYNKRRFLIQKKMVDIELDALRSKLDPHFIFNILNSLQLQINLNDTESSEKLLILFSNHIRNAFDYSHKQSITVDQEINFIREYLSLETIRFKDRIKWDIKIDPRLDIQDLLIPSMLLQPYVENAIKHGFKDKVKEAELKIDFLYVDKESFQVKIMDNGKGISTDPSLRKSSTSILDERIQLLNQSAEWKIVKTVSNLNPGETDKGTIVTINFTKLEVE